MGPPVAFHTSLQEAAFAPVHETVAPGVGVSSGDCHRRRALLFFDVRTACGTLPKCVSFVADPCLLLSPERGRVTWPHCTNTCSHTFYSGGGRMGSGVSPGH